MWVLVPAAIMASVEAGRVHDQQHEYSAGWEDAERTLARRDPELPDDISATIRRQV